MATNNKTATTATTQLFSPAAAAGGTRSVAASPCPLVVGAHRAHPPTLARAEGGDAAARAALRRDNDFDDGSDEGNINGNGWPATAAMTRARFARSRRRWLHRRGAMVNPPSPAMAWNVAKGSAARPALLIEAPRLSVSRAASTANGLK